MARNKNESAENTVETTTVEVVETLVDPAPLLTTPDMPEEPEATKNVITSDSFNKLSLEDQLKMRADESFNTDDIPLSKQEKEARFAQLLPPFQQLISLQLSETATHNGNVDIVKSADPEKFLLLMSEKRDANPWQNETLTDLNAEREKVMAEYERLTAKASEVAQTLMADSIKSPEEVAAARVLVAASSASLSTRRKVMSDFETQMMSIPEAFPDWYKGYLTDMLDEVKNLKGIKTGASSGGIPGSKKAVVRIDEFWIIDDEANEETFCGKLNEDGSRGISNAGMAAKELTSQLHNRGQAVASTDVTKAFYDGYNKSEGTSLGYNDSSQVKPGSYEFEMTWTLPATETLPEKVLNWKLRGVKNAS